MKKLSLYWKLVIVIAILTAALNLIAISAAFCDAYTDTLYSVISDVGGRITDFFPFILGELLMYLSAFALVAAIILALLLIPLHKKERFKKATVHFLKGLLMYVVIILFIYTVNWSIPFRGRLLGGGYETTVDCDEVHLRALREYLILKLNEEAKLVPRNDAGTVIWPDNETVREEISISMHRLSDRYPRLSGYYPKLKAAWCSEVLDYMFIAGYTYPYTMELTWNRYIDRFDYPSLFAHEASHHQGYYKENEANYLSFLACTTSEDPTLRYSGYYDAYYYVNKAYASYVNNLNEETKNRYESIKLSDTVLRDKAESLAAAQAEFDERAGAFDFLKSAAEQTADVGWETQGEVLGSNSYDGVVPLLLEHFKGTLYEQ